MKSHLEFLPAPAPGALARVQGCLLGQLAGDALGSLVEFRRPEDIRREYPKGVRLPQDGGTWGTIAGQPTDDSEMALALARSLAARRSYDPAAVREAYRAWPASGPFDCNDAKPTAPNCQPLDRLRTAATIPLRRSALFATMPLPRRPTFPWDHSHRL